jgi:hypothetical protein
MILRRFENCYDVWRIDTTILGKQWFRDDAGEEDFKHGITNVESRPENLYVVAFGDIPRDCIKRARIKVSFKSTKFNWGVLSMRRLKLAA